MPVADRPELSKSDMLIDPLIRQLMEADGVAPDALAELMAQMSYKLGFSVLCRPPASICLDDIASRSDPRFEPCSRLLRMRCSPTAH